MHGHARQNDLLTTAPGWAKPVEYFGASSTGGDTKVAHYASTRDTIRSSPSACESNDDRYLSRALASAAAWYPS